MHLLVWSYRTMAQLHPNNRAVVRGVSPGPAEDAAAGPLCKKNSQINYFLLNALSMSVCNKCTIGAELLGHWQDVLSSHQCMQHTENSGTVIPWWRKLTSCFLLLKLLIWTSALVSVGILLFYLKWGVFNKDLLSPYRYLVIRQTPDRKNWINFLYGLLNTGHPHPRCLL